MLEAGSEAGDPLPDALVGRTLSGKWTVERRIGEGGMAVVYAARHRNGRRVALKVLRRELSANARAVRRFVREGYLANKIEHPGAVAILDDDVTEEGDVYLVLELLEGTTLSVHAEGSRAAAAKPCATLGEILDILVRLLDVLGAAHRAGIVHRDVKPSNVLVTTAGEVKLLDFGIARLEEGEAGGDATRSGATLGTPGFMAPEQARGRSGEIDARTDVWAVGALGFWLLAGRQVHEAETPNELVIAVATQPVPSVARFVSDLPDAVVAVIDRALSLGPSARWPDAMAMRAALEEARRKSSSADLARTPERRLTKTGSATLPDTLGAEASPAGGDIEGPLPERPAGRSRRGPDAGRPRGWVVALAVGAGIGAAGAALLAFATPAPPSKGPRREPGDQAGAGLPAEALPRTRIEAQSGREAPVATPPGAPSTATQAPFPSAAPALPGMPAAPASARRRPVSLPSSTGSVRPRVRPEAPADLLDVRE